MPNRITLMPLGQGPVEVATERKKLKREWFLKHVPSFEVWAAATCYDGTQDDGGQHFQSMMFFMLTHQVSAMSIWRPELETQKHYVARSRTSPKLEHGKKPGDYTYGKKTNYSARTATKTSATAIAGTAQSLASDSRGWDAPGGKPWMAQHTTAGGGRPEGFIWWWESAGMSFHTPMEGKANCSAGGNRRQFVTQREGTNSDADKGQAPYQGCVNLGTMLAAYFGLYYYPECRGPENNWTHTVQKYRVRMRMPNPAYRVDGTSLRVYEKSNYKEEYLGGDKGFEFPRCVESKHNSGLVWDGLAKKSKVTKKTGADGAESYSVDGIISLCAPWAGVVKGPNEGYTYHPGDVKEVAPTAGRMQTLYWVPGTNDGQTEINDHWQEFLKGSQWAGRQFARGTPNQDGGTEKGLKHAYGEQTGGLNFGWAWPAALWLYPHYGKYDGTVDGHDTKDFLYQPYPLWNKQGGWRDFPFMSYDPVDFPICAMLEAAPRAELANRQLYALGLDYERLDAKHEATFASPDGSEDYVHELYKQLDGEVPAQKPPKPKGASASAVPGKTTKQPKPLPSFGAEDILGEAEKDTAMNSDDEDAVQLAEDNQQQLGQQSKTLIVDNLQEEETREVLSYAEGVELDELINNEVEQAKKVEEGKPKTSLQPGSSKEGENHRFYSLRTSPWPPLDVYEAPVHSFEVEEYLSDAQVKKYAEDYGSTANLVLRSNKPVSYKFAENKFGRARVDPDDGKRILDMKLDGSDAPAELKPMFQKHLRRILSIYWDTSGDLAGKITPDKKRKGMENGLWVSDKRAVEAHTVLTEYTKGADQLLPPVFSTKPTRPATFTQKRGLYTGNPKQTGGYDTFEKADVEDVKSSMTVLQWLQTPWHYEYLPFQPMNSIFKDGETFCMGCTRCSRPFYDYEHLYSWYHFGEMKTAHWVHQYFHEGMAGDIDKRYAPQPFHHPKFWSEKEVRSTRWKAESGTEHARATMTAGAEDGEGFHNWPTHGFMLGWQNRAKPKRCGTPCNILGEEWNKRLHIDHLVRKQKEGQWTFRRYLSHTFDDRQLDELVQGVVRFKPARVIYGMRSYKLMRSVKFGNVCLDCMRALDKVGLYTRSGRVAGALALVAGKKIQSARQLDTWWLSLKDTILDDGSKFDPWFIYIETPGKRDQVWPELGGKPSAKAMREVNTAIAKSKRAAYKKAWPDLDEQKLIDRIELHLKAAADKTRRHCENLGNTTKHTVPPEIYVQKHWEQSSANWVEIEEGQVVTATHWLDKIIKWLDKAYVKANEGDDEPLTLTNGPHNRALRDFLHDTHYALAHVSAYKRQSTLPRFDPDMEREEYRNLTIKGKEHCLRTVQMSTPKVKKHGAGEHDEAATPEKYEVVDGLQVTRTYVPGTSDWAGDDYVKLKSGEAVQVRKMTQSNLFITYSLHRRVNDELVARGVLEKMADAVRWLFGNDENFCQIVLFGMRLANLQGGGDSVSAKTYVPIDKARKKTTTFYGKNGTNSYLYDTYQTHVESVSVDAGIEIGPTYHMPHFHILVTINHWSYVHIDTYRMKSILEQLFKGTHMVAGEDFALYDGDGKLFYGDNENAYVDIRLYPSDNWADVVAAYVRKGAARESMLSLRSRAGQIRVGEPLKATYS